MNFEDAIKSPEELTRIPVANNLDFQGQLFLQSTPATTPAWLSFISPHLDNPPSRNAFRRSSVSGVLCIRQDVRIFALTFGYGRALLEPTSYEPNFGLITTLNLVDHTKLRSLDTKTYEDLVLSTRKQTSKHSELGTFALDTARELLRAVVGKPDNADFATLVAGSDSLTIQANINFDEIGDKCEDCLEAYGKTKYKEHFGWIDHLKEVRDPSIKDSLDQLMVSALKGVDPEGPYLAPTDIIEWENIDRFGFTGHANNVEFLDLDISYYLRDVLGEKRSELTIEKLKQHQVRVKYSDSSQWVNEWTIYSCLVWEVKLEGELYAFMDERWFHIETSFAAEIAQEIGQIPHPRRLLPTANLDESEEDYNIRVGSEEDMITLDQRFVSTDGNTKIEICDLFSKKKQLIHVKKKNHSATLSHLFAQGVVSALALLEDREIRTKTKELLTTKLGFTSLISAAHFDSSEYEIAYVVVVKQRGINTPRLPFFSQVFLAQQARILRRSAFHVALQIVTES